MEFKVFKLAVQQRFKKMEESNSSLYRTNVTKDEMWDTYLNSFPAGTNNMYKERNEYDCQSCRQFVRAYGNVVAIGSYNELISIWDVEVDGYYQEVADALSAMTKSKPIRDRFFTDVANLGTDCNHAMDEDGNVKTWNHFSYLFPTSKVVNKDDIPSLKSKHRDDKNVFQRSLEMIIIAATETVLDLIAQKSLYKGDEFKAVVGKFLGYQFAYNDVFDEHKDNWCWTTSALIGGVGRIKNSAIGTLLIALSDDEELDVAVRAFEKMVAPANYKRPTALITKRMIEEAQKTIIDLGYADSLGRRFAVTEDITVNNVLFADRDVKAHMKGDVFDELIQSTGVTPKTFDKVEEITIDTFVADILPTLSSVELMLENKHTNNLMSIVSPQVVSAPSMLKWNNNFSWAYNGDLTDSIKEKVKAAGGNVEGVLRCSLSWFNYDDLDIHVKEPNGHHIHYGNKKSSTSGVLDVDMNINNHESRNAVENIVWTDKNQMIEGEYHVWIHNYSLRETTDVGFEAEIEFEGKIHTFAYTQRVSGNVSVARFKYSKKDGIKILKSLPSSQSSKEIWGISTHNFHKVSMMMLSPNHWNSQAIGNKHYMFILENCKNDSTPRGFFNEFLKEDLTKHRKVFEALGAKMRVEPSDNQLSGIGFSSTMRNSVVAKITGTFTRTIKINF